MSTTKGEHGTCSTVKIKVKPCPGNADGVVEINKSEYNPDTHELVGAESDGGDASSETTSGNKKKKKKSGAESDGGDE